VDGWVGVWVGGWVGVGVGVGVCVRAFREGICMSTRLYLALLSPPRVHGCVCKRESVCVCARACL